MFTLQSRDGYTSISRRLHSVSRWSHFDFATVACGFTIVIVQFHSGYSSIPWRLHFGFKMIARRFRDGYVLVSRGYTSVYDGCAPMSRRLYRFHDGYVSISIWSHFGLATVTLEFHSHTSVSRKVHFGFTTAILRCRECYILAITTVACRYRDSYTSYL